MRFLATIMAALSLLLPALAADKPNIVIFLADDLGYGSVGYQGGEPKTPTLATLAKNAVRFTDFYHYIAFHEPHTPIASPPELVAGYPDATPQEAEYYANVENMDGAIGRYLVALQQRGLTTNTLVLFASDNGPLRPGSSGGLRAGKEHVYDGGIKVPAVLSWPARVPQPRTVTEPVGVVDVLPTLCAAAGIAAPTDRVLDGTSFLPLLTGGEFARKTPLFWHYFNANPGAVLRSGDWNLVAGTTGFQKAAHHFALPMMETVRGRTFDTFELYNLREDPAQKMDRAAKHPEKLAELKRQLFELLASSRAEGPDWRDLAPKP